MENQAHKSHDLMLWSPGVLVPQPFHNMAIHPHNGFVIHGTPILLSETFIINHHVHVGLYPL